MVEVIYNKTSIPPFQDVIPLYYFPSPEDMLSFQSVLRERDILETFEVDGIRSQSDQLTAKEHLKIWRDFGNGREWLSFYQYKAAPKGHIDLPIGWFEAKIYKRVGKGKEKIVHIKFHFSGKEKSRIPSIEEVWNSIRRVSMSSFRRSSEISMNSPPPSDQNVRRKLTTIVA